EPAFVACLDDPATLGAIAEESAAAERLGLVEPPTFLIDGPGQGRVLGGDVSAERVRAAVAEARLSAPSTKASASP
ncbi:MAG: hypothetical protein AB1689_03200, partial [Thermodesulfobacteriota bacterium]